MTHRRGFFRTFSAAALAVPPGGFSPDAPAKAVISTGAIGRVLFCRASDLQWLRLAREICGGNQVVAEVDRRDTEAAAGAVLVGSAATLVIGEHEFQILR